MKVSVEDLVLKKRLDSEICFALLNENMATKVIKTYQENVITNDTATFNNCDACAVLIKNDGSIISYSLIKRYIDSNQKYFYALTHIFTLTNMQQSGYGKIIFDEVIRRYSIKFVEGPNKKFLNFLKKYKIKISVLTALPLFYLIDKPTYEEMIDNTFFRFEDYDEYFCFSSNMTYLNTCYGLATLDYEKNRINSMIRNLIRSKADKRYVLVRPPINEIINIIPGD